MMLCSSEVTCSSLVDLTISFSLLLTLSLFKHLIQTKGPSTQRGVASDSGRRCLGRVGEQTEPIRAQCLLSLELLQGLSWLCLLCLLKRFREFSS